MAKIGSYILVVLVISLGYYVDDVGVLDVPIRQQIQSIYTAEVGVREVGCNNCGPRVEQYLASVNLKAGNPYCAAFVSWVLTQRSIPHVKTGWSPGWFPNHRLIYKRGQLNTWIVKPGQVFGIYFPDMGRIAHVGFVDRQEGSVIVTVEGNTSPAGSRDGQGVYKRRRLKTQIYAVAEYLTDD